MLVMSRATFVAEHTRCKRGRGGADAYSLLDTVELLLKHLGLAYKVLHCFVKTGSTPELVELKL